jgi:signal transduction histidine kinase/DNA-binding response OmpR family regulator
MIRIIVLFQLTFFLLIFPFIGFAKRIPEEKIDSLRKIQANYSGPEQVDIFNQISWEYRNNNPDSAIYFAQKAHDSSIRIKYSDGEIKGLNYLGIAERNKSHYSKAFEYFVEALKISEEVGNLEQKGYTLINIGNIYIYQTNYVGAIEYFENAIEPAILLKNKSMEAYCYLNLGRTYSRVEQYDKASEYLLKTRRIREELNDEEGLITSAVDLGELYRLQGDLDKSLEYLFLSIESIKRIENHGALAYTLNDISKIYRQKDELNKALRYAKESLKVARQYHLINDERKILENLSLIYQQLGDHKTALSLFKSHIDKKDSIFNEENTRKIEGYKSKYEAEKAEAEKRFIQEKANLYEIILIISIVSFIVVLIAAIVLYRSSFIKNKLNKKIQSQNLILESDNQLIEQQSKKLEELDLAKSRFFSNISHDLRSPLSLIMGNYEQIKKDKESFFSAKTIDYLDVADKNARRLLYLTDEINELTKLEEGMLTLKLVTVKIVPYLQLLVKMFSSTAKYKSIEIIFNSALKEDIQICLDPVHFEKIIYNLVSNALKYSKAGDSIKVELGKITDKISIVVQDTGDGIPEKSVPFIFDRYYQSPENKHHVYEGLGIGLALVKELIELHEGSITVASKQNEGTKFSIILPIGSISQEGIVPEKSDYIINRSSLWADLWEKTYNEERIIKVEGIKNTKHGGINILIVDDHPEVREYLKLLITKSYNVVEAENGIKALEVLNQQKIDLVVTDLMMPWMDGFELLESMRENEEFQNIPVLVVSARNDEEDKFKVLGRGVNDILQKPFSHEELMLRLNNLLEQKSKWNNQKKNALIINDNNLMEGIEKELLEKIEHLVLDRIDENLSVMDLANVMAASERKVYRMIKKLTNLTPLDYIKEIKWQYLEKLLKEKSIKNATEASKVIGMKNVTNFKKQFSKRFNREIDEMISKTM